MRCQSSNAILKDSYLSSEILKKFERAKSTENQRKTSNMLKISDMPAPKESFDEKAVRNAVQTPGILYRFPKK